MKAFFKGSCVAVLAAGLMTSFVSAGEVQVKDCAVNADVIGASYSIVVENKVGDNMQGEHKHHRETLQVWRESSQVIHHHPHQGFADSWRWLPNGLVRQVRYFDKEQRAIEFEPSRQDWGLRSQLVSANALAGMQRVSVRGKGCQRTEQYQRKGETLWWNPALRLVVKRTVEKAGQQETLKLTGLKLEPKTVSAQFAKRLDYQATDYADIGDSESDPFLKNMIRVGFIDSHHH